MPAPVFAPFEILTADEMNKVGLWKVASVTGGNGAATLPVNDVFSSDYLHYRVIVTGGTVATGTTLRLRLGSSSTGYYAGYLLMVYSAAGGVFGNDNNAAFFTQVGHSAPTTGTDAAFDVRFPFETQRTRFNTAFAQMGTALGSIHGAGYHNVATSYTGFTLSTASAANWTSDLTVTVYGYNA